MSIRPWAAFLLLSVHATLSAQGCSSTSTNPTNGGSGGGAGTGAGGACCGASEVPECSCGCPSLFPTGDFDTDADVSNFGFDCSDTKSFVTESGCGALQLTGSTSQHCARKQGVSPMAAGGKCAFARIRIKSSDGGSVALGVDGDSFQPVLEENPPNTEATFTNACRLPDPYQLKSAFINVNQGSQSATATVSIDFVEIFVASCKGPEPPCQ